MAGNAYRVGFHRIPWTAKRDSYSMTREREYGIDVMKIVAMIFIVADHILLWGGWGLCSEHDGIKGNVLAWLDAVTLCHVNCFVLASGYVMSRLEFKFSRIVKLWLEVFGYSLAFLVIATCFFPSIELSAKDWIKNLLPIAYDRYWFFTQYVGLFFIMPVLNAAIRQLDKKLMLGILIACTFLLSVHPFVFKTDLFHVNRGYSLLWFVYLYLIAGSCCKYEWLRKIPFWLAISASILGGGANLISLHLRSLAVPLVEGGFPQHIFRAYNNPLILVYSVSALALFTRIKIENDFLRKWIAIIGSSVFSVYVIHSNPIFRVMTNWNENWTAFLGGHSVAVDFAVAVALLIFCTCISVDVARKKGVDLLLRRGWKS